MTMKLTYSTLAAGLIGGVMLATGAMPAAATSLAPVTLETGHEAQVEQVRHWWGHRPGRTQGERYWQQKNAPDGAYQYGQRGPTLDFGLDVPRGQRFFGLSVPRGRHGAGAPWTGGRHGRISR
jgi:hypothetical protein